MRNKKTVTFVFLFFYISYLNAEYIHRCTVLAEHGKMTFIGNTLGLSKQTHEDEVGTCDAIGAFITLDTDEQVSNFPPGTTLDYTKNSAASILNIPEGSTILYAELVWGGSYGYSQNGEGEDPNLVLIPANGPITFTTPLGKTHEIMSDPSTRQNVQNGDPAITYPAGNYCRSQNVTELVIAAGGGTYVVGHVPSTISGLDNTHNAAGWALAVIYKNPAEQIHNMSFFVGCEQASSPGNEPAEISGFVTPFEGTLSGRLLVCGIERDANKTKDHMAFGPTADNMTYLTGPNNGNDFFASQINGDNGELDISGTFGNRNPHPPVRVSAGKQGWDITNVDCSSTLSYGQTSAFAQGITNVGGEDFTINALGIQILVEAPIIEPIKKVNNEKHVESQVGDTVTFSISMTNTGSVTAHEVLLKDELEHALMPVPGSCRVNGLPYSNANYTTGIHVGDIPVNETAEVDFRVKIDDFSAVGNMYGNTVSVDYVFRASSLFASNFRTFANAEEPNNLGDMFFQSFSNTVTIFLPSPFAPQSFTGKFLKCKFINKTEYSISTSWTMPQESGVIFYRIYDRNKVIGEIPVGNPLVFKICLLSKSQGKRLEVAAVYDNFAESIHVPIQIID